MGRVIYQYHTGIHHMTLLVWYAYLLRDTKLQVLSNSVHLPIPRGPAKTLYWECNMCMVTSMLDAHFGQIQVC